METKNIEALILAIKKSKTHIEIKQAKIKFGFRQIDEIEKKVNEASLEMSKKFNLQNARDVVILKTLQRKDLLKKYVGTTIFYIGVKYEKLYKNRSCQLIQVNENKCLVHFSEDEKWNLPFMDLYPVEKK